jgi:hypothetical protein
MVSQNAQVKSFAENVCKAMGIYRNAPLVVREIIDCIELYNEDWAFSKNNKNKVSGIAQIQYHEEISEWIFPFLSESERHCIASLSTERNTIDAVGTIENRTNLIVEIKVGIQDPNSIEKLELGIILYFQKFEHPEFFIDGKFNKNISQNDLEKIQTFFELKYG